jgi:hypothetical protein
MDEDLEKCKPAIGYLANAGKLKGVLYIGENIVSEELLHACNFWIDHVVQKFQKLALWSSCGNFF